MKIGINWTSPRDLELILHLKHENRVDYVEILVDNFLHLEPSLIRSVLGDLPVAIHIMSSKFLTSDNSKLEKLASLLKKWFETIDPIYVSDHLGLFELNGNISPLLIEINYLEQDYYLKKTENWQSLLQINLLLENYPSYTNIGMNQLTFFNALKKNLNILPLFDISNAIIANKNIGIDMNNWAEVLGDVNHFHCGGFREIEGRGQILEAPLILDSHDTLIDSEVSLFLNSKILPNERITLTIERDADKSYQNWIKDRNSIHV